jgi:hypothetical protein
MNKYERLFEEISEKTASGEINWKQVRKDAHWDLIFNPALSFRQYSGTYEKNGDEYEVVLVEKKIDDLESDYPTQRYIPEILVIGEGEELIATLTDSIIDRGQMIELVQEVEHMNDRAKKLFE